MYSEKAFSKDVTSLWGAVSHELVDHDGLLHLQIATLGRLCLDNADVRGDVLEFLSQVLGKEDAIAEIENAMAISFLEWPELEQMGRSIQLPTSVANVVREQWEKAGGNY